MRHLASLGLATLLATLLTSSLLGCQSSQSNFYDPDTPITPPSAQAPLSTRDIARPHEQSKRPSDTSESIEATNTVESIDENKQLKDEGAELNTPVQSQQVTTTSETESPQENITPGTLPENALPTPEPINTNTHPSTTAGLPSAE